MKTIISILVYSVCLATGHGQILYGPPNDMFANRIDLGSGETVTASQEVVRASQEFDDPVPDSLWWQWTAPRDGWFELEVQNRRHLLAEADLAGFSIFRGELLGNLVYVGAGSASRKLFRSEGGLKYQIGGSSPTIGAGADAQDLAFTIRPSVGANISPASAAALSQTSATSWTASGWAVHSTQAQTVMNNESVYQPLFWRWTCPTTGVYFVETDRPIYPQGEVYASLYTYRGNNFSGEPQTNDTSLDAVAGEIYTLVTGVMLPVTTAHFHQFSISLAPSGPYVPTNTTNYVIPTPLPQTIVPPLGVPQSRSLNWTWTVPHYSWFEFSSTSNSLFSRPDSSGILRPLPFSVERNGKHYLWMSPGQYSMTVEGCTWPQGSAFTLSPWSTAPSNDLFASATTLTPNTNSPQQGTFLGATRSLGDPLPTLYEPVKPTVWYTFHPSPVSQLRHVARQPPANSRPLPVLRIRPTARRPSLDHPDRRPMDDLPPQLAGGHSRNFSLLAKH